MATRDNALGVNGADIIIGSGVVVSGNLRSEGDIYVDGTLDGEINAAGDVTIGVNGVVKAHISAMSIKIGGEVTGNIKAENEVIITESGQLRGNIVAAGLAITSGGIFNGTNKIHQLALPLTDTEEA